MLGIGLFIERELNGVRVDLLIHIIRGIVCEYPFLSPGSSAPHEEKIHNNKKLKKSKKSELFLLISFGHMSSSQQKDKLG